MTDSKKPRGFAAISPERQREISSMGGKAAHVQGRAHEFTSEEARAAGRKGGHAYAAKRKLQREARILVDKIGAMTPEEKEAQRRSFAFGNAAMSDPDVTRETIDAAADAMTAEVSK